LDLRQKLVEDHGLHQVVVGTTPKGGDGVLDRGERRDHHHQRLGTNPKQSVEELQAVSAWELHVAKRQVRALALGDGERPWGVSGDGDLKTFAGQELFERRREDLLVVDDQDPAAPGWGWRFIPRVGWTQDAAPTAGSWTTWAGSRGAASSRT